MCASCTSSSTLLRSAGTHEASRAMPAFPGAQKTSVVRGDCRSFHTKACSRPPPPKTRIRITFSPEEPARLGVTDGVCQRQRKTGCAFVLHLMTRWPDHPDSYKSWTQRKRPRFLEAFSHFVVELLTRYLRLRVAVVDVACRLRRCGGLLVRGRSNITIHAASHAALGHVRLISRAVARRRVVLRVR